MEDSEVLSRWAARKVQPVVLLYVVMIFLGSIAVSFFVFHSMAAVKALAMAAVVAILPLVPSVLRRVEYRFSEREIERRPLTKEEPKPYEHVIRLDELSHIVPLRHGFKYYKPLDEENPLKRFWKLHVSDAFSGEVHVERADLAHVLDTLTQQGVSVR